MIGRKNTRKQSIKRVAVGSSVAAAAGYVAGILTAPKSGKETRGDIKKAANKGVGEVEKDLKKARDELEQTMKDVKSSSGKAGAKAQQEAKQLLAKAKEAKDKASDVLSAVKAGSAEDKELDRAVKQAKHALKNLREYLKK